MVNFKINVGILVLCLVVSSISEIIVGKSLADSVSVVLTENGSYKISVDGNVWFSEGSAAFHSGGAWFTNSSGLKLASTTQIKGDDKAFGSYTGTDLKYMGGDTEFHAIIKYYANIDAYVFTQSFPQGSKATSISSNADLITAFPTFNEVSKASPLYYLTYNGNFAYPAVGTWPEGFPKAPEGGSPVVFYNEALRTLVFSPLDQPMISIQTPSKSLKSQISFGMNGEILEIPAGFEYSTILINGHGLNDTLFNWGSALLAYHGKERTKLDADLPIQYLGYWTDNGAYYYYLTEPNKNYEQTMLDIKNYVVSIDLPVENYQLDSWWYFKGISNGVLLWEPMPDIFPDGLGFWNEKVDKPLTLHNRYFSPNSKYIANYTFIVESFCALPLDENLFTHIMGKAKEWGMVVYEQDWLITTYEGMKATQNSVSNSKKWLTAMGNAAKSLDLTIQYCMPLPIHNMQSAAIQPVTQIRASNDYNPGNRNWEIGHSSQFIWSLGAVPFKDDFWTTPDQPGCKFASCVEPNTVLITLVAALSTGPVGPSDQIGKINRELVMKTCTASGLLLKADKPATPVDSAFLPVAGSTVPRVLNVLDSFTAIGDLRWHYVLAIELTSNFTLKTADLALQGKTSYVFPQLVNSNASSLLLLDDKSPFVIPPNAKSTSGNPVPFSYFLVAPKLESGWVFLGERDKFVTVSKQRVESIVDSATSLKVTLKGTVGEEVTLQFYRDKIVNLTIKFTKTTAVATCDSASCSF